MSYVRIQHAISKTHPNLTPQFGETMEVSLNLIATVIEDLQRQVSELSNAARLRTGSELLLRQEAWRSKTRRAYEKWASDMAQDAVMWVSAVDMANKTVTVTNTPPTKVAPLLSAHIPYAGVWEYKMHNGFLNLIQRQSPPAETKNWISVQESGTLSGPDIGNLVFTVDQSSSAPIYSNCSSCGAGPYTRHSNSCTGHVYTSPWYNLGAAGGRMGGSYTIPVMVNKPSWSMRVPNIDMTSPNEVGEAKHKCRCPREAFALNGAGCHCGGV